MIRENRVFFFKSVIFFFLNIVGISTTCLAHASTLFSDNFTGTTIDTVKWVEIDSASGGSGGTSGNVRQNGTLTIVGNNSWNANGIKSVGTYDRSSDDLVLNATVTSSNCSSSFTTSSFGYGDMNITGNPGDSYIVSHYASRLSLYYFHNGSLSGSSVSSFTCTNNVSFDIKLVVKQAGGAELYINGSATPDATVVGGAFTNKTIYLQSYSAGATSTYEDVVLLDGTSIPDAPSGLVAVAGNNQATLNWTAPYDGGATITDYIVEYKLSSDSSWSTFNDGTSSGTTVTVTGLGNGSSYDFRVAAVNSVGTGDYSDTTSTSPGVPGLPTDLFGTPSHQQVSLSWQIPASSGGAPISDYVVEYRIGSGSWSVFSDGISVDATATVTSLINGTTYEFRVSAVNSIGTGSPSQTILITVGALGLIDDFTGTVINTSKWTETDSFSGGNGGTVGNVQQNGSLTATGNNSWGMNGLQSVSTFDRTNGNVIVQVTMSGTTCTATNLFEFGYGDMNFLASGTSYVVSNNAGSWLLFYFLNGVNQGSVAISGVNCIANVPLTMKLVVKQAGGAELYINGSTSLAATYSGGTFTHKPVWIQAQGSGATTTFDNLYVIKPGMPEAPSGLSANAGDGQVDLDWSAPNDNGLAITDYFVQYKLSSSAIWLNFSDGTSNSTSAVVTGLTNGLEYSFKISAINVGGTSSASGAVVATPLSPIPAVPSANAVVVLGAAAVGETLTGSYIFADPNGDLEGASQYRWLSSDSPSGAYTVISGATGLTYIPTLSDFNKYIKFEVIPVSVDAPTHGSEFLSPATMQVSNVNFFNHILSTGQSLSIGYAGSPALSTTQPYNNKKLSGSSLIPLTESGVESMSSSLANSITYNEPSGAYDVIVTMHGQGSTAYTGLKKGTAPYANGMTQATNAHSDAIALGRGHRVSAVTVIHGESDHIAGITKSQYEANLLEWKRDYENDVQLITGQSNSIPLFTDQMSSWTGYSSSTSVIPYAQLEATENYPSELVLIGPKYFLNYVDAAHLSNASYRWLGEYYAKAYKKVILDGDRWTPLSPRQIIRHGNVVYVQFNVPTLPIVFDATLVDFKTNYGFEYTDDSSSASINTVEILTDNTVKITLNTIPTGLNQKLRYAYTGIPGSQPGAHSSGSARGNLRDSDAAASLYGNTLYNWAVHFDKSITVDDTAPLNSNVNIIPDTNTATVSWDTNEEGSSIVDYGLTSAYGSSTTESDVVTRLTSHSRSISGLLPCVTYHYRVRSKDLAQNEGIGSDNTFTTTGCTGSAGVVSQVSTIATLVSGGSLNLLDDSKGIALMIPAFFGTSDANFQIKKLNKSSVINATSIPAGYVTVGNYIYDVKALSSISSVMTSFDDAITVSFTYEVSDISGINESSLKVYRWDGTSWHQLSDCLVDTSTKTVSCTTTAFSIFGLFGQTNVSVASDDDHDSSSKACENEKPGSKAPRLYSAFAEDDDRIRLSFTATGKPVTKYMLEYGTVSGQYPYKVKNMGLNDRSAMSFTVASLSPSTTYYFRVRGSNGCARGSWSNEISAKTKGLVITDTLDIVELEMRSIEKTQSCQVYKVVSGDSLWSISKKLLGNGNRYKDMIEQNKERYPSLLSSSNLQIDWELHYCDIPTIPDTQQITNGTEGSDVQIKIVDMKNKPVEGATITFHSNPQTTMTDKNGIALFHKVEQGNHRILIAYQGYKSEQSINFDGDATSFELVVKLQKDDMKISSIVYGVIGGLAIILLMMLVKMIGWDKRLLSVVSK